MELLLECMDLESDIQMNKQYVTGMLADIEAKERQVTNHLKTTLDLAKYVVKDDKSRRPRLMCAYCDKPFDVKSVERFTRHYEKCRYLSDWLNFGVDDMPGKPVGKPVGKPLGKPLGKSVHHSAGKTRVTRRTVPGRSKGCGGDGSNAPGTSGGSGMGAPPARAVPTWQGTRSSSV